ncbi:polysaccharide deacetylase family protein [Micromonospora coxensis]|uniref:polysaccharide deacetylase family protein n=1 Tax=Micromonospora coxensis TaxID=356852 RepID=UPI00341A53D7
MNERSSNGVVRRIRAVLVAAAVLVLVAAVGVVVAPSRAVAADTAPYRAAVFTKGYDSTKLVTLTFDSDWPTSDDERTRANIAAVLDTLAANGITAGFGLTGRFVTQNPDATRAIAAGGHKLINHSWDHPDFLTLSQSARWSQLDRAEAAYRALGLTSAGWFRTPYRSGYLDPGVNRDLALRGWYVNLDWTYDTTGYQAKPWSVISQRIDAYTVPGAILVMHVSAPSTDPGYLQAIIDKLRGMGYGFASPYRAVTVGGIRSKYFALGGPSSAFGAPVTAEMVATTSGTAVQWFQRGRIYWRSGVGTYYVFGGILTKYRSLGTVTSFLGFPLGDEQAGANGGRYQRFQGGSVYWSSATGAHTVNGAIRTKWTALGAEAGFLGYPVSDEVAVTGGRASQFQGGNVYWSSATGAHEVHGAILSRYVSLGGTGSRLGLPTTDEYAVTGGRRSDFQHGAIVLDTATGTTRVIYT